MLEDQWSKIGVDLTIVTYELSVHMSHIFDRTHLEVGRTHGVPAVPWTTVESLYMSTGREQVAMYDNPVVEELWYAGQREMDPDKRADIMKEIFVIWLMMFPIYTWVRHWVEVVPFGGRG